MMGGVRLVDDGEAAGRCYHDERRRCCEVEICRTENLYKTVFLRYTMATVVLWGAVLPFFYSI